MKLSLKINISSILIDVSHVIAHKKKKNTQHVKELVDFRSKDNNNVKTTESNEERKYDLVYNARFRNYQNYMNLTLYRRQGYKYVYMGLPTLE